MGKDCLKLFGQMLSTFFRRTYEQSWASVRLNFFWTLRLYTRVWFCSVFSQEFKNYFLGTHPFDTLDRENIQKKIMTAKFLFSSLPNKSVPKLWIILCNWSCWIPDIQNVLWHFGLEGPGRLAELSCWVNIGCPSMCHEMDPDFQPRSLLCPPAY